MPRLLGATPARGLPPSFDLGKEVRPSGSRLGRTRRAHGGAESSRALRLPAARRRSGSRPCRLRRESRPSTRKELFSGASCLPASACKARANLKGSEGGILRARHPGLRTSESAGCGEPSLLSRGSSASESGPDTDPQKSGAFSLCQSLSLSLSLYLPRFSLTDPCDFDSCYLRDFQVWTTFRSQASGNGIEWISSLSLGSEPSEPGQTAEPSRARCRWCPTLAQRETRGKQEKKKG